MELSQLTITDNKINTKDFISSLGGLDKLYTFLKKWSNPEYSKQRYSDHSWGLIPYELDKIQNRIDLWNEFITNLLSTFQIGNTVIQHQNGKINSWIAGRGYQSYGLTLDDKLREFSSHKFTIQTLESSKRLKSAIEKYIGKHQHFSGIKSLYPNKVYCLDTILNPITETEIGTILYNELGFVEKNNVILQRIDFSSDLIANLPGINTNFRVYNILELLKKLHSGDDFFSNISIIKETKSKKEVKSGFENKSGYRLMKPDKEKLQASLDYMEKNPFVVDQFVLIQENKIVAHIDLNLLPIFENITLPTRRINTIVGESNEAQNQLLGYVIKYLYQKGVKSLVMVAGANSSDRKIFEQFRNYTSLEQTLFTIYRKEGPHFSEISSWIEKSETVDYIEIAKQRLLEQFQAN